MKLPKIIVVIPFKGQIPILIDTINSIFKSYVSGFYYSMLLWDDGSTLDELDYLYSNIHKSVLIVRHENVGYTKAIHNIINTFKQKSEEEYILLANSDLEFRTGAFNALAKRIMTNQNIAAVGGKILNYNGDTIIHTGTVVNKTRDGVDDPYCNLHSKAPQTMNVERRLWVNGCCCLYNLDILRKCNLNFNLDFTPAYFEEADLMTELNYLGYSVLYEPRAEIGHMVNATMNQERDKYEKVFWGNWNKYKEKWFPKFKEDVFDFGIR